MDLGQVMQLICKVANVTGGGGNGGGGGPDLGSVANAMSGAANNSVPGQAMTACEANKTTRAQRNQIAGGQAGMSERPPDLPDLSGLDQVQQSIMGG